MSYKIFSKHEKTKKLANFVHMVRNEISYNSDNNIETEVLNRDKIKPLKFVGSVKLHGTNASIIFTKDKVLRCGKRNGIIGEGVLDGSFGFPQFVHTHREYLTELMNLLFETVNIDNNISSVILFGEWAGQGVQNIVSISEIRKSFFAFAIKVVYDDGTTNYIEHFDILNGLPFDAEKRMYNIYDFGKYEVEIDFDSSAEARNIMHEHTMNIEGCCPVAKQLINVDGIGEGLVWYRFIDGRMYNFKTKGDKHSKSKNSKSTSVDIEVVKGLEEFTEYACTDARIMQGIKEVEATSKRDTGKLLKWIAKDIIDEESDTMEASFIEWKDVNKYISKKTTFYFFKYLEELENKQMDEGIK